MKDCKLHGSLAKPQESVLLVVDVQDRLIGTIDGAEMLVANITALLKTAAVHEIPVVVTEQEKLGATVGQLKGLLEQGKAYRPISKQAYSCWRKGTFRESLAATGRKRVLVTGIEAHVCVAQTALDLLANGYQLHLVADAVSSHSREDHRISIDRLARAGATVTTTEALIFELTATAASPLFRQILAIVKDRRSSLG